MTREKKNRAEDIIRKDENDSREADTGRRKERRNEEKNREV